MALRLNCLPVRVLLVTCVSLCLVAFLPAAKKHKGAIRKLTLDENAPVVELFEGMQQGVFEVRVAPKNEFESNVFITNTSNKPKTVALPKAVVAVHVLKQQPFQGLGQQGFGNQNGGQQGGGQSAGGGLNGGGNNAPGGGGFFSIPPEKTVQLQLNSVCLDYGKPHPRPKMKYVLRRAEEHTSNVALRKLLEKYDPRKTDRMAMQAAAWHLSNGMSWETLQAKARHRLGGLKDQPFFTTKQLDKAKQLVGVAAKDAREDATESQAASRVTKKNL